MLVAPLLAGGLRLRLTTPLVSAPYVHLTAAVMASFGVAGVQVGGDEIVVPEGRYQGTELTIEPDASSASYPLAMAAVAGGRVQVRGLHRGSAQGDVAFADLLGAMGCTVDDDAGRDRRVPRSRRRARPASTSTWPTCPTSCRRSPPLPLSPTTPTTITGVGFIRAKESDRLGDLAAELRALGADVTAEPDGLRIEPAGPLHGAELATHHDHRLAMAFGVLGTVVAGIGVADPDVVAKSWPGYWAARDRASLDGPVITCHRPAAGRPATMAAVPEPGDLPRPVVAAFDVDGTVTIGDCVVPFLRMVAGTPRVAGGHAAPRSVPFLAALAHRDRDRVKALASRRRVRRTPDR